MLFCDKLLSISKMFSRLPMLYLVSVLHFFLFPNITVFYGIHYFVHLSVYDYLGGFYFMAYIKKNGAMNIPVYIFVWTHVFISPM